MDIRQPPVASRVTAVLCFLSALCEGFDVQAAGVAATGITHELHCTPSDLGLFFSASGAGLLIGSVIGGRAADRWGRKTVLTLSIGMFGLFSLWTSFMPSLSLLTIARFLTGLGLGGAIPTLIAFAAETSAPGVRNRSIGTAYAGMPIGGALASVLAFLLPSESWRELFRLGGLAPLLIVPALIAFLPGRWLAACAQPGLVPEAPRIFQELFGRGRALKTLLLWISFFLIVLMLHLMLNWLPFLLTTRGLTKDSAMLAQAGFGIGGAFIALGQAALLDSAWRRAGILGSIIALPLILVCVALLPAWPATVIALVLLLGGAILAQQVIVFAVGSTWYSVEARGTALGAAVAAGRAGSLAGPLFAAALLASGRSAAQVLLGVLPIALACGGCVGLASRSRRSALLLTNTVPLAVPTISRFR
jgi:AAHS family 3-hydroxyphenylpropionic acid transporter